MVVIDYESMGMTDRRVAMGMAVRLGSFPTCMIVLVVLVVDMQMVMLQRLVLVHKLHRIGSRPQLHGKPRGDQNKRNHGGECRGEPESRADPAGRGIGDEPAGVREGKLRGEQCWPIFALR